MTVNSKFIPKRLTTLVTANSITYDQLALNSDISRATLNNIVTKGHKPGLKVIVSLADYFGISIDYFFDRVDDETAEKMLRKEFAEFQERRKIAYEQYIGTGKIKSPMRDNFREAPWPYNLIEAIYMKECEDIYPHKIVDSIEDRLMGPDIIMNEKRKDILLMYFKELRTLDEIAVKYDVCSETIRQQIRKGLRILRKPAFTNWLMRDEEKKRKEIKQLNEKIEELNAQLQTVRNEIEYYNDFLKERCNVKELENANLSIEKMDLSVRSYNCLVRAGCHTIMDVITRIKKNELISIRNLGRKSQEEIFDALQRITGNDYRVYL